MAIPTIDQLETAFAYDADVGTIVTVPQINPDPMGDPNQASFEKGFPAITMQQIDDEGLPPKGPDFNGVLNSVSQLGVWQSVGGGFNYNAALYNNSNPYITGYPVGARVKRSDNLGYWVSTVDNNQTDPDSPTSIGWVEDVSTSPVFITITVSGQSVLTVTKKQAASLYILVDQSAIGANIVELILPYEILKNYTIVNDTTSTLRVKTNAPGGSNSIDIQPASNHITGLIKKEIITVVATSPTTSLIQKQSTRYWTQFIGAGSVPINPSAIIPFVFGSGTYNPIVANNRIQPNFPCRIQVNATFSMNNIFGEEQVRVDALFNGGISIAGANGYTAFPAATSPYFINLSFAISLSPGEYVDFVGLAESTSNATANVNFGSIDFIG